MDCSKNLESKGDLGLFTDWQTKINGQISFKVAILETTQSVFGYAKPRLK